MKNIKYLIIAVVSFSIGASATLSWAKSNMIMVPDNFNGVDTIATLKYVSELYADKIPGSKEKAKADSNKRIAEDLKVEKQRKYQECRNKLLFKISDSTEERLAKLKKTCAPLLE